MVGGEWVAIDGSKFRAAASRKAVPSVGALERQVGEYLATLDASDATDGAVIEPAPRAIQAALAQLEQARQVGPGRALTEPEARLMQGTKGPAYNVQSAVDTRHGVIVAHLPVNRSINNHGDGELFDRRAFKYEPETDRYCCPAGQWLLRKQLHRKDRTITYAAALESCAECALKARCTGAAHRLITRQPPRRGTADRGGPNDRGTHATAA